MDKIRHLLLTLIVIVLIASIVSIILKVEASKIIIRENKELVDRNFEVLQKSIINDSIIISNQMKIIRNDSIIISKLK